MLYNVPILSIQFNNWFFKVYSQDCATITMNNFRTCSLPRKETLNQLAAIISPPLNTWQALISFLSL